MPDTASPSAAETHPSRPRRVPGSINIKYLNEIDLAGKLAAQARLSECVEPLAARQYSQEDVKSLETAAANLNEAALKAVGRTSAREMSAEEETIARARLLDAIEPIWIGAKRSYRGEDRATGRSAYFVNEPVDVTLERLLFIAGAILQKLCPTEGRPAADTLKGVTLENLDELATARAAYVGGDADPSITCEQAAALRVQVEELYAETREKRIDLQLAADQAWSHKKPENASMRRAFHLPENRPAHE